MADSYAKCSYCRGRRQGCVLCAGERARDEREAESSAYRRWQREGIYVAPGFREYRGDEVVYERPLYEPRVIKRDIACVSEDLLM